MPPDNRGKVSAAISRTLSSRAPAQAARCAACVSRYREKPDMFLRATTISLCATARISSQAAVGHDCTVWGRSIAVYPVAMVPRRSAGRSWLLKYSRLPPWLRANGIVAPPTGWIPRQPGNGCLASTTGVVSPRPATVWLRDGRPKSGYNLQMPGPGAGRFHPLC